MFDFFDVKCTVASISVTLSDLTLQSSGSPFSSFFLSISHSLFPSRRIDKIIVTRTSYVDDP